MSSRRYEGPALDATGQHISEAPYWQNKGETVDVVDDDLDSLGEETTENVPSPDDAPDTTDLEGQTTFDDWRWSA